jgi:hypothetical protein
MVLQMVSLRRTVDDGFSSISTSIFATVTENFEETSSVYKVMMELQLN